jgi:hypothetical protein
LEPKNSSKKRKVSIQESSSESELEIEFESADSGDAISDVYFAQDFPRMIKMAKNGPSM